MILIKHNHVFFIVCWYIKKDCGKLRIIGIIDPSGDRMDSKELMQMFTSLLEEKLQPLNERMEGLKNSQQVINERLETLDTGQQVMIEKLDNVSEQVASNTEKQTSVESVAVKVAEHDTDIKLLKKFITN